MPDESDERGDPERAAESRKDPDERPPSASEDGAEAGVGAGSGDTATAPDEAESAADETDHPRAEDSDAGGGKDTVDAEADGTDDATDPSDAERGGADEADTGGAEASDTDDDDANGVGDDQQEDEGDESATEREDPPAVETDGEGYASDYVGDRLQQYKPTHSSQNVHDNRELPSPPTRDEDEDEDDWDGLSTPPDDEEMPLADHIEEMMLRLSVVLLFGAAGTAIGLLGASDAISFIWSDVMPQADQRPPHIYHPLELWLTRIKVSALLGILVALPAFVYQCYLFMRPGLYPHERKYYLAAVPTSVVLAGLGMVFSYLLVLPLLFSYFTFYSEGSAQIAYALGDTFDLIITLTGFLAIVFQIPLFIMLAIMMGVTTREWLADKRLYFWAGFAGLSFMFTMDPTLMAPVFVAITMVLLFEGTLLLLKWTGR